MAQSSKTFRVFISSTFNDLKAERNALQERVFPRLRALCQQYGARFQPIDLRWGVSEEASLDQQAMSICLGEIARCQQTSPRPNFIILLGDRYGWCPPPPAIKADDFEKILNNVQNEDEKELLRREWYQLDLNAVPPVWILKPRVRGTKYEKSAEWSAVETKIHNIIANALDRMGLPDEERLPFVASATEQEIFKGALSVTDSPEHVLCFLRSIDGLPRQFDGTAFRTHVDTLVKQEFPNGSSDYYTNTLDDIFAVDHQNSAAFVANRINQLIAATPKATKEEEFLNFLFQALTDFTARDYVNLNDENWNIAPELFVRQSDLKNRLQEHLKQNAFSYTAGWTGTGISTNHIDQLCEDVFNSLAAVISSEIENPHPIAGTEKGIIQTKPDEYLDDEGHAHRHFAEERMKFFVGRDAIRSSIRDYTIHSQKKILIITGEGGTGKSALMAKAIHQTLGAGEINQVVYRFIGATPSSTDGRGLLESLCHEITRRYGGDSTTIPIDYRDLVTEFTKRLSLANAENPLVLFLDSLDQLSAGEGARSLTWLPSELPDHVSLIVSTRGGTMDTYHNLSGKSSIEEELKGLENEEGDRLLNIWLENAGRTLQNDQMQAVLAKFQESQCNPLYLKLAFEEAKLWKSFNQSIEDLATGVSGIIEKNMIDRLQNESTHGEKMVAHTLGYLAASRHGLSEDEIVDLLSRDQQVYEWFFKKSYHLPSDLIQSAIKYRRNHGYETASENEKPSAEDERAAISWLKEIRTPPEKVAEFLGEALKSADGPRLPIVLWSRLSFDLAPYLTERMVDGSPLLHFYHRELGEVAATLFLEEDKAATFHERLADYFQAKADPDQDRSWTGNYKHGLSEIPYHLTMAEKMDEVYHLLTDFSFLENKAAEVGILERKGKNGEIQKIYTGVLQLQEDYERVLAPLPGGGGSAGLSDRPSLILTAIETSKGLMVYCPVCNQYSPVNREVLDTVIQCPQENCGAAIKLNPFTVKREI